MIFPPPLRQGLLPLHVTLAGVSRGIQLLTLEEIYSMISDDKLWMLSLGVAKHNPQR